MNIGSLFAWEGRLFRVAKVQPDHLGQYSIVGFCLTPQPGELPLWNLDLELVEMKPITVH